MTREPKTLSTFSYRGMDCEVVAYGSHVNGYMTGKISVDSYDEADRVAEAHGGFTYYKCKGDGRVTLGFDTVHYGDGPETQNEAYVTGAIKSAVDSLIAAGVVGGVDVQST